MNLVIVESPAKAATIKKFLTNDYIIKSSIGHVRDMPKKDMGIDIDNNFKPTYVINTDKKKIISELKKIIKTTKTVYLATDDDREGEAIAWHLLQALKLPKDTPRIVFHEITKDAVISAIKNPRIIDYNLVDAQQARRIIDRIVGFEISPILWRKISGAKSAGRVQSPVVRLVTEREREINIFKYSSVFKTKAILTNDDNEELHAKLNIDFNTIEQVKEFAGNLLTTTLTVTDTKQQPLTKSPKPPFITSTLQQEASQKLGFSVKRTMSIAQNLYRNGLITYMRTDSTTLAKSAVINITNIIKNKYGEQFIKLRTFKTKVKGAQEAHEAIRPTDFNKDSIDLEVSENKLYQLIYKRTLASQMADAKFEKTTISVTIKDRKELFIINGETLIFAGFTKVYNYISNEDKILPIIKNNTVITLKSLNSKQTFDRPKPRYTEASLVKTIESMGIGRPSTFATMISTVQDRGYIIKENREGSLRDYQILEISDNKIIVNSKQELTFNEKNKLFPSNVAYLLTDFLTKYFGDIVDYNWTAKLEEDFDKIAICQKQWQAVIADFYQTFHQKVINSKDISRDDTHNVRELGIDPVSSEPISVRFGRYGAFAQKGSKDDDNKPIFASLKAHQNIETITLNEALELFNMPRVVGEVEKYGIIKTNYGRFGPYIQYQKKYVSIKDNSPEEITLAEALTLIADKEQADAQRIIKVFDGSDIQILNGRFGPYITNGKKPGKGQKNITISKVFGKDQKPIDLTLKECNSAINKYKKVKRKKK